MQYYLVRLSYTAAAWRELVSTPPQTAEGRLDPVLKLAKDLGGAFATFEFPENPSYQAVPHKFVSFGAEDVVAVIAMPDEKAAKAFAMTIAAEEGVKDFHLTPLMPFEQGVEAMKTASAKKGTYKAPGR